MGVRRIIKWIGLATGSVVVALVLHWCYRHGRDIEVCIRNVDAQPLRSGEVAVRSRTAAKLYAVGDLAPNERECVWVNADGESSVDVTFRTPNGPAKTIPLTGYIEPGYSGWILAEVTSEGARFVEEDIDFY